MASRLLTAAASLVVERWLWGTWPPVTATRGLRLLGSGAQARQLWPLGLIRVFPHGSAGKESARNAGDPGLIPGWRRPPGEGIGCPL